jgi:hypothetical protein
MSTAAAQVVAHRTPRIVAAAGNPNARDRREFALMGREKLDGAAHSAYAVGSKLWRLNYRSGTQMWLAMLTASTDMLSGYCQLDVEIDDESRRHCKDGCRHRLVIRSRAARPQVHAIV